MDHHIKVILLAEISLDIMSLSIFECVFVQNMTVNTCVFEGAPAGTCMWKASVYTRWPPLSLYPLYFYFWDRISCWTWTLPFHLQWLGSKHPESSYVAFQHWSYSPFHPALHVGAVFAKVLSLAWYTLFHRAIFSVLKVIFESIRKYLNVLLYFSYIF